MAIRRKITKKTLDYEELEKGSGQYMLNRHVKLTLAIALLLGQLDSVQAGFNIPTDMTASPLTINGQTASAFTAKVILFEEFGLKDYHYSESCDPNSSRPCKMPPPQGDANDPAMAFCQNMPAGDQLDDFLKEDLYPAPYYAADDSASSLVNAWDTKIRQCVGLAETDRTYAEGRPAGEWFAHQRYDEFPSQAYFQTAMTGSRINGGLRDRMQRHDYNKGEFAPKGLYHNTVFSNDDAVDPEIKNAFNGTTRNIPIKIHPNLPVQGPHKVWTFDGTLPPKLLQARYGESILFRHYNALPIDDAANGGFGKHTITTHEHNGHNPAESDGFAGAFFFPGQYYDYHWPMVLAGHDSINTTAADPWAGAPDGNGGITPVPGDWHETMSTHWFHDHMVDYTAQNVYKGNAAMMNYYSAIDRGREPSRIEDATDPSKPGWNCNYANASSPNMCLPSGSSLDWGNRDYDVNLVLADKAWDNAGQLKFNIFNADGFLGDMMTVNWIYKPYMEVRKRKYRFRMLNGSVSRIMKIAIVDSNWNKLKYHMIANDGNLMEHAIAFPNNESPDALPQQSIAERYDFIIDFNQPIVGNVYLVNLQEHTQGRGPSKVIPLADIKSGKYKPNYKDGDPAVGRFMEFRLVGCGEYRDQVCTDLSMNPVDYEPGKKKMIPMPTFTNAELKNARHRTFEFVRTATTDNNPWAIKTDGGADLTADMNRISAALTPNQTNLAKGAVEIWHIKSSTGWLHPVHVHFEEGRILYRDGKTPPSWERYGRKDMYRVGGPGLLPDLSAQVDVAIRVREFAGTYVEHCHNTQHEDHAMLMRWDSKVSSQAGNYTQAINIPEPLPTWQGVGYATPTSLPTAISGDTKAAQSFVPPVQPQ
jgi:FtsP/CotA-like multicopper oxidase with cupredoxin domain